MVRRRWILVVSLTVLAAVLVLAASLHDVRFQPGRSISFDNPAVSAPLLLGSSEVSREPLWKVIVFWAGFILGAILLVYLLPAELRKRLLRQIISMVLFVIALLTALRYRMLHLPFLDNPALKAPTPIPGAGLGGAEAPHFQPPVMAAWMTFLISLVVLAGLGVLAWRIYRWWQRSQLGQRSGLEAIGEIARSSLDEIQAGRDWGDVIIESYVRMNEAVSRWRGLQRPEATTPREFAERLEKAGLPGEAVDRLTRLFEMVRYGTRSSSRSEVDEAVACLSSILRACGEAA